MLNAVRTLGGRVTAAVAGSRALADAVAGMGFDRVLCLETAEGVPVEAYAAQVADTIEAESPRVRVIVASDEPTSRILLGAAAARLGAAIIGAVRGLAGDGNCVMVSRSAAEGKIIEDIAVEGALAVIFDGDDVEACSKQTTAVEVMALKAPGEALRLVEIAEAEDSGGLLTASRVVGVGLGLVSKNDLELIEELADAMNAEIACTLPLCDDMRWFPSQRVLGSTYSQVAPDLYIAVGISGSPHHMSGVRDAKVVVAVNNDPDAKIFQNCDYGILGDLYKILPELASAFKNM